MLASGIISQPLSLPRVNFVVSDPVLMHNAESLCVRCMVFRPHAIVKRITMVPTPIPCKLLAMLVNDGRGLSSPRDNDERRHCISFARLSDV